MMMIFITALLWTYRGRSQPILNFLSLLHHLVSLSHTKEIKALWITDNRNWKNDIHAADVQLWTDVLHCSKHLMVQNVPTCTQVTKTKVCVVQEANSDFLKKKHQKCVQFLIWQKRKTAFSRYVSLMRLIILGGEIDHSALKDEYFNSCQAILSKYSQEWNPDNMEQLQQKSYHID